MSYNIAINGYGRIGQALLRALYQRSLRDELRIVAINERADTETIAYLTRYDTSHGQFPLPVSYQKNTLLVGDDEIQMLHNTDPEQLPWKKLDVDLLFECSGSFKDRATAQRHLDSGAKKILISHPADPDMDATIVFGINENLLSAEKRIVSNASCTTNCIVPVLNLLDKTYGIDHGLITTIHSAMNDQPVIDSFHHSNLRLTRSALHSIIPVDTSLSKGIERILPAMTGKFQCLHMRVPTINVSLMDLSVNLKTATTAAQLNATFSKAAREKLPGLLGYTEEPLASVDFNGNAHSGIIDGTQTRVSGDTMAKLVCWFDNESGFANRMLDTGLTWLKI